MFTEDYGLTQHTIGYNHDRGKFHRSFGAILQARLAARRILSADIQLGAMRFL